MSAQAHPRFIRRRSTVREHTARRHLRRALWVLGALLLAWAIAWIAQSPLFSVRSIEVTGQVRADVTAALATSDVYEGRPLILIRSGEVAAALEADPWIKEATVRRGFPDHVAVRVIERYEVAVVKSEAAWSTVSDDGRIMRSVGRPPGHLAIINPELGVAGSGGVDVSEALAPVVEFVQALPGPLIAETVVGKTGGELVATVAGHRVRLGTATNMAAKASALVAVLDDERLAPGAVIDLIAPLRPAVSVAVPVPTTPDVP